LQYLAPDPISVSDVGQVLLLKVLREVEVFAKQKVANEKGYHQELRRLFWEPAAVEALDKEPDGEDI
jgi:hypothetical protein